MKQMKRRMFAILMAVCMAISCMVPAAYAEDVLELSVGQVEAEPGAQVTVPVLVKNNTGIAGLRCKILYDPSVLTFVSVQKGEILGGGTVSFRNDVTKNQLTLTAYNTVNCVGDGALIYVTFQIAEDVEGTYALGMYCPANGGNLVDASQQEPAFVTVDGSLVVAYPVSLTGIALKSLPTKTEYEIDEELDVSGLVLTGTYSDGSTQDITEGFAVTGFDSSYEGEKKLTVSYKGYTVEFSVRVKAPVIDENAPQVRAVSTRGVAGNQVKVNIDLKNNPGLVSAKLKVAFDSSVMTLVEVQDTGLLPGQTHRPELKNPYPLSWSNDLATENITANGTLVSLVFQIAEDAPIGFYPITVTCEEVLDYTMAPVSLMAVNGTLEVIDVILGDVNGDTFVNGVDRAMLTRYLAEWDGYTSENVNLVAADVNLDGEVTGVDRAILTRHLAEWAGYETLPYTK